MSHDSYLAPACRLVGSGLFMLGVLLLAMGILAHQYSAHPTIPFFDPLMVLAILLGLVLFVGSMLLNVAAIEIEIRTVPEDEQQTASPS